MNSSLFSGVHPYVYWTPKKWPYFAPKRRAIFQDGLRHFYSFRGVFSWDGHSSYSKRLIHLEIFFVYF